MTRINEFDLSRYIPDQIKYEIRKNSGFGCVVCGFAICQYDHVDPEFHEAKEHDSSKMTLLCGHCHDKKTRSIYLKSHIKRAMLNPKALENGFTFDSFDIGDEMPNVILANYHFNAVKIILRIDGKDMIKIEPPEVSKGPFLLTAFFYDTFGNLAFKIERNEWCGDVNNSDIKIDGTNIIIKDKSNEICLHLQTNPDGHILIKEINMHFDKYHFIGNAKDFHIHTEQGVLTRSKEGVIFEDCEIGVEIKNGNLLMGKGGSMIIKDIQIG